MPNPFSLSARRARWKRTSLFARFSLLGGLGIILAFNTLLFFFPPFSLYLAFVNRSDHMIVFDGQILTADGLLVGVDQGGNLLERIAQIDRLRAQRTPVFVQDICASACTLNLTLPQTCTAPTALWMFHKGRIDPHSDIARWSEDLLASDISA